MLVAVLLIRAMTAQDHEVRVEPMDVAVSVDGAAERLAQAIREPTISPWYPEDDVEPFVRLREFLEESFPRVHEVAERRLVNDLTLHYVIEGDPGSSHVVFLAHMDVVPVEETTLSEWTHPPFDGVVADGFVWGRGTLDNKQNVMAIMEAAEQWLEEGARPEHTLHFVFGHDEEVGGTRGAKVVADEMKANGLEVVAVFDEGLVIADGLVPGVDEPVGLVGITEKGYLTVEIVARGDGGHASMPPEGLAVVRLSEAMQRLRDHPMPAALDGPTEMMLERTAPRMNFGYRVLFRNLWLFRPVVLGQMTAQPSTNAVVRTTAAPTMLRASPRENVLPQQAVGTVNFRIHPRDSIDGVLRYLEELLPEEYYQVEPIGEMRAEPSPLARLEGPGYEALERAVTQVYPGLLLAPNMLVGAADARHFTGLTSDVYRFQPIPMTSRDLERIHGTDERIAVEHYEALIRYYAVLLRQW